MNFNKALLFFFFLFLFSCQSKKTDHEPESANEKASSVVEVIAQDFTFEVNGDVLSGWNTFKFHNKGHAEHFFLLNLLPDTILYLQYVQNVTRPFDAVYDSIKAGMSTENAIALLGSSLPSWYFTEVTQMGGPGIVGPMSSAQNTMKLVPGNYVMECYIKEKGIFHTALGMIRPMTVTDQGSDMKPPQAGYEIELFDTVMVTSGQMTVGLNTVAVHFKEHPPYELGNDVHLIRLEENTEIANVISWLNWMNLEGLEPPAPATFLGGTQEMPVGHTAYFTVDLKPGSYAWIAESGAYRGLVKEFDITQ